MRASFLVWVLVWFCGPAISADPSCARFFTRLLKVEQAKLRNAQRLSAQHGQVASVRAAQALLAQWEQGDPAQAVTGHALIAAYESQTPKMRQSRIEYWMTQAPKTLKTDGEVSAWAMARYLQDLALQLESDPNFPYDRSPLITQDFSRAHIQEVAAIEAARDRFHAYLRGVFDLLGAQVVPDVLQVRRWAGPFARAGAESLATSNTNRVHSPVSYQFGGRGPLDNAATALEGANARRLVEQLQALKGRIPSQEEQFIDLVLLLKTKYPHLVLTSDLADYAGRMTQWEAKNPHPPTSQP